MAVMFITATRHYNTKVMLTFYIASVMTDGYAYFEDDVKFRVKQDLSSVQMFYVPKQIWVNTNLITDVSGIAFNGPGGGGSVAANANVERAVQWAIDIANDNTHGYDQGSRNGPDYDCSSLVWHSLHNAGFNVGSYAFNTDGMISILPSAGFTRHSPVVLNELQRGDILWRDGHTEIYIGNQQCVGAHSNEFGGTRGGRTGDQTGREISVGDFYNNWTAYYRYEG